MLAFDYVYVPLAGLLTLGLSVAASKPTGTRLLRGRVSHSTHKVFGVGIKATKSQGEITALWRKHARISARPPAHLKAELEVRGPSPLLRY